MIVIAIADDGHIPAAQTGLQIQKSADAHGRGLHDVEINFNQMAGRAVARKGEVGACVMPMPITPEATTAAFCTV